MKTMLDRAQPPCGASAAVEGPDGSKDSPLGRDMSLMTRKPWENPSFLSQAGDASSLGGAEDQDDHVTHT